MIECQNLVKEFGQNPPQRVLHGIDLKIQDGEFASIIGKSGSGKSTLLYLLSTLDLPTSGVTRIDGQVIAEMSTDQIHSFRNRNIGFIFQFHYLLPELTAIENLLLPARNLNLHEKMRKEAQEWLVHLGIGLQAHKLPSQMSGGEQQRVAIARALLMKPRYIFADEPTGNLDSQNAELVMNTLLDINQKNKTTIVLVTHDPDFSEMAQRKIHMVDGRVKSS